MIETTRSTLTIRVTGNTWEEITAAGLAEAREFFGGHGEILLAESICAPTTAGERLVAMQAEETPPRFGATLEYRHTPRLVIPRALPTVIGDWVACADLEARIREMSPDAPDDLAAEGVEFHQYRDGTLQRADHAVGAALSRDEWEARGWAFRPQTVEAPVDLLAALVDGDDCQFDHHGGCQAHGYLSLEPGEECPQAQLAKLLAQAGCA